MILLLALATMATVLVLCHPGRDGDLPQRIVVAATNRLPADRHTWSRALVAELAAVDGFGRRWRFAAGVARIALFPPARQPTTARTTAAIGCAATVVTTLATLRFLPTLSIFVAAFGLMTSAGATAIACRRPRSSTGSAHLVAAALAVSGVLAAVGAVIALAATHPAATRDQTHIFSLVLAATLTAYLITGLSATAPAKVTPLTVWSGVAGAGGAVLASAIVLPTGAIVALIPPITVAAALATGTLVGVATRNRVAAARAGVIAAVLSMPAHFAIAVIAAQSARPTTLTNPYDIAAYARSGSPDVASYVLGDDLAGNIVSLATTLLAVYAAAAVAAVAPRSSIEPTA